MTRTQNLFGDEIFENGSKGKTATPFGRSLASGYRQRMGRSISLCLGREKGSSIANAMDIARGYSNPSPPLIPPMQYTYYDQTSDYATQVTECVYWATTTYMGGQDWPERVHANFSSSETDHSGRPQLNRSNRRFAPHLFELSIPNYPTSRWQLFGGSLEQASVAKRAVGKTVLGSAIFTIRKPLDPSSASWMALIESGPNGIWLYHSSYGWMWTNSSAYPWIYFYSFPAGDTFSSAKHQADSSAWTATESFSVETSGDTNKSAHFKPDMEMKTMQPYGFVGNHRYCFLTRFPTVIHPDAHQQPIPELDIAKIRSLRHSALTSDRERCDHLPLILRPLLITNW